MPKKKSMLHAVSNERKTVLNTYNEKIKTLCVFMWVCVCVCVWVNVWWLCLQPASPVHPAVISLTLPSFFWEPFLAMFSTITKSFSQVVIRTCFWFIVLRKPNIVSHVVRYCLCFRILGISRVVLIVVSYIIIVMFSPQYHNSSVHFWLCSWYQVCLLVIPS